MFGGILRSSVVGFLGVFALHGSVIAQKASYEGDVRDVQVLRRVEQHPQAWRIWQPVILQGLKKQHLIVAYGSMLHGKKDMGDIHVILSRDDGLSWSEPNTIFSHDVFQGDLQFAYANPVLYRVQGQAVIWCFAMRCPIQQRNSEESHLVGAFTADGGRSWTSVELAMHYTGPLILNAPPVEVDRDGVRTFLLPAHRNTLASDPRGSRDHMILSSTSLLEWKLEAFIPQPNEPKVFLHEGNLARGDQDGELRIVMRTANYDDTSLTTTPPRAYSSLSQDGGKTWSVAAPEPELHNAKSKGFYCKTALGHYLYVYNDGPAQRSMAPGFPFGGRTSLRYKIRIPRGNWLGERTFFDAGIKNSYPSLVEVSPCDFRAVWDSGTAEKPRTHIRFAKFKIEP